ncbi:MAG: GNAT family N-acetyltransferase [Deinococcales bacterium]
MPWTEMVNIRPITLDDAQGFWQVLASVAAEKKYILTIEPPVFEKTLAFVQHNVDHKLAQYVALDDDKLVGWADILPLDHPTMSHIGSLGMGILAAYRGQGIGSKLLKATIDHAWASGLKRLELEVFADNVKAIALYEKHGYIREGLKPFARQVDGHYQDIVLMGQYRL